MWIARAKITNFRNLAEAALDARPEVNLIVGKNAQGKTNLLEALFLATQGTSFRVANGSGMIKANATVARAELEMVSDSGETKASDSVWSTEGGRWFKRSRVDGVTKRADELAGIFPGVVFSPEDLDLIRLSPQYRRRFLDKAISALSPEYGEKLFEYGRVLRQRNQLLLMIKQGRAGEAELDVWDERLAELGVFLIATRQKFVMELDAFVGAMYEKLFEPAGLRIAYVPNVGESKTTNYLERLRLARALDIVRATTSKGPHRDDVVFWLNGLDVRMSASRGEFRSIVLAIRLAEGRMLEDKTGEKPIYFLDDILSELDGMRRIAVARELAGHQIWLTTSDELVEELFGCFKVFSVNGGVVSERAEVGK